MGDVAHILGDTQLAAVTATTMGLPKIPEAHQPSKAMKLASLPKSALRILAGTKQAAESAILPPIVPAFNKTNEIKVKVGNKFVSSQKAVRPWAWAPFASSSRTDGAIFRHWVRANVEYADYPYAKFDIHLDPVTYTEDEYSSYLRSDTFTKSETDMLVELARKYELRWAVIHDRWLDEVEEEGSTTTPDSQRKIEDLQERYYSVAATISQIRIAQEASAETQALASMIPDTNESDEARDKAETLLLEGAAARALATSNPKHQPLIANVGTGSTNKLFDVTYEKARRQHLDRLWKRSKQNELEEVELRKELKNIDMQLKKLKKSGGHILAASSGGGMGSRMSSAPTSRSVSPVPGAMSPVAADPLHPTFSSTIPTPVPGTPYLQSARLFPPATGGSTGINKTLLTRMDQVMEELKVNVDPLPTKRVCDLYDSVRKDVLTLLTLQKLVMQNEGSMQTKRVRLSKLGGEERVLDEEALLGIQPAPPPPVPTPAPAPKTKTSRPKSKASTVGTNKKQPPKSKATGDDKADPKDTLSAKKPKSVVKRKRKSESKTVVPVAGVSATKTPTTATTTPLPNQKMGQKTKAPGPTSTDAKQSSAKKRARKT